VVRTSERLRATLADADTATLLRVARGAPLLAIRRVALSYNDDPVELRGAAGASRVLVGHRHARLKPPVGAQGYCVLPHCRHRSLRVMFGHRSDGTARQSQCDVRVSCRNRFADATRRTLQFLTSTTRVGSRARPA